MRSDGNGGYNISKRTTVTLSVVILLITALVGFVSYAAAQGQVLTSHVADGNIHWCKGDLDEAYMPRGETEAKFDEIFRVLSRIETNTRRD